MGRRAYGVKRYNNNNVLELAEVRNNRTRGLVTHAQTNHMNVSDKQPNCTVQWECSTDKQQNAIHNPDQLAAAAM
jgi:hypothetical protein